MNATPSSPNTLSAPNPDQRRTAAVQYQHANQWLIAGQPEKATIILRHCCLLDPGNLIYRQALGTVRSQLPPAHGLFARLKKWTTRRRLRSALRGLDPKLVLQFADELLAFEPGDVEAHLAIGTAFQTAGLLEHAVACLQQCHAILGKPSAITGALAMLYEQTGRFSQARALMTPQPKLTDAEILATRLEEQIAATPANPQLYLQLVALYRQAGDPWAARDWLQRGLQATANHFELTLEFRALDIDSLRHDAAVAEQKLTEQPDNTELTAIRTRLLHEIQAREIELCRYKADRYPSNAQCQLELGTKFLKAGQFEAALETLQMIQSDAHLGWQAVIYSGYCHLNLRQWHKAKPLFERALSLLPPDAETTRQELLRLLTQKVPLPPASDF